MIVKKCRHGAGLKGAARTRAWRRCQCSWMASVTVEGARAYVNLGRDETQAAAQFHRLQADNIDGRTHRMKPGREFSAVADSYMHSVESAPGARPNRVRTTRTQLGNLKMYWGETPVDGIAIQSVRVFIDDITRSYSSNYASALYSTFRAVLGHAQDHGLIDALPVPAKSRIQPRNKREPNHLTVPEAALVIAALRAPYDAVAELAMLTGLRVGELLALDSENLDRERRVLHVRGTLAHDGSVGPPKTGNGRRVIPLSPRAFKILDKKGREGRLFPEIPSLAMAGFVMRDALNRTGLYRPGVGWHGLRHLHATLLEASGLGIREAAARLGHGANMAQSMAYGWTAEAGDASAIDSTRIRLHDAATSSAAPRRARGSE